MPRDVQTQMQKEALVIQNSTVGGPEAVGLTAIFGRRKNRAVMSQVFCAASESVVVQKPSAPALGFLRVLTGLVPGADK